MYIWDEKHGVDFLQNIELSQFDLISSPYRNATISRKQGKPLPLGMNSIALNGGALSSVVHFSCADAFLFNRIESSWGMGERATRKINAELLLVLQSGIRRCRCVSTCGGSRATSSSRSTFLASSSSSCLGFPSGSIEKPPATASASVTHPVSIPSLIVSNHRNGWLFNQDCLLCI